MNRMRVLAKAYQMLLRDDPGTSISLNALRTIVKSGYIPTVQVGRKTLVNYDAMLEFFLGTKPVPSRNFRSIR